MTPLENGGLTSPSPCSGCVILVRRRVIIRRMKLLELLHELDNRQVKLEKSQNSAAIQGQDDTSWEMVLDEGKLFGEVPDAPVGFSATPYSTQISLRWDPPANGSTPISHYLLMYGEGRASETMVINSDITQYTLSDLRPGTDYVLSLRAANEFGSSNVSLYLVVYTKNPSDPSNVLSQDILQVIGHPLPNGVTFTEGLTGAAFKFEGDSNAGRHAEIILPTDFSANFPEFSILMLLRPYSGSRGTVFGVTDPYHQTIILSVNITGISIEDMRISLILTNIDYTSESTEVAAFLVPSFTNHWTQLALSVRDNQVTLFLDCQELGTQTFDKDPGWHIRIPPMAPLFIGHLGTVGEDVQYRGDIQQISITNSADSAEEHCPIDAISGSGSMALRQSAGEDWAFVVSFYLFTYAPHFIKNWVIWYIFVGCVVTLVIIS
nr:collagen alpha-1(XV) chain-like [Lytechinus pictus]